MFTKIRKDSPSQIYGTKNRTPRSGQRERMGKAVKKCGFSNTQNCFCSGSLKGDQGQLREGSNLAFSFGLTMWLPAEFD